MSELEEALKFIEKIEQENAGKSVYEIANTHRGYTKLINLLFSASTTQ